jgi:hypothetical protein
MSFISVQKWDYLDCGFMCVAMQTMQTHLEQQHSYKAAVSPENNPNVLVAVIVSRLHNEECARQTAAVENRLHGDCQCIGWECSISDVNLPQGRVTVEEYLRVHHGIDISEASSRI